MENTDRLRGNSSVPHGPVTRHVDQSEDEKSVNSTRRDSIESVASDANQESTQHAESQDLQQPVPPITEKASILHSSDSSLRSVASSIMDGSLPKAIFTPNTPASGTQTPAACRPLTRRRDTHERKPPRPRSKSEADLRSSPPRSRPHQTSVRLEQLRGSLSEPIPNSTPPSPQMTPAGDQSSGHPSEPLRQISEQADQSIKELRAEVEQIQQQLSSEEASRQRELLAVNYTINRILKMQKSQMRMQNSLGLRFDAIAMQAQESEALAKPWHREPLLTTKKRDRKRAKDESQDTDEQTDGDVSKADENKKPNDGESAAGGEKKRDRGRGSAAGSSKAANKQECKQQRSRVHERDSDIEPDSPVEENSFNPEMDQPSQGERTEQSEVNKALAVIANRTTHAPPPQHRHQRLHDRDSDQEDEDRRKPPSPPPKSQAQLDAEQLADLASETYNVMHPLQTQSRGQLISELRSLIHWHQDEGERARNAGDMVETLRHRGMQQRMQVLLERNLSSLQAWRPPRALGDVTSVAKGMGQTNSTPANAAASPEPETDIYEAYEYEFLYPFCPHCNENELHESPYDDREVNGAN
ncbi:hypothetical protein PRZ48_010665 [Zasmidium cellare]|uniref:Uncharacterized protein n=1 Tax=Zasmidium cellare TaxID=395010 RepID=A0ABR0E992_ZASCE|nr:hypothetical protein PRZ48_010665 [Zasmidium cellare]